MSDVTWRSVSNFSGYQVSSDGRVRSIDRIIHFTGQREPRLIRGCERKTFFVKGYEHLALNHAGRKYNFYVHLLVCEAFHGPRPSADHEARHLNGDPTDNRADNLAWGTKSENAQDSIRHGHNKEVNKTECKYGHAFIEENTMRYKRMRICRTCHRNNGAKYYAKHREAVLERQQMRRRPL